MEDTTPETLSAHEEFEIVHLSHLAGEGTPDIRLRSQ